MDKKNETLKYARHNGGDIVGDRKAIENEKRNQLRDIIDNQRLGGFDSIGNYYLEDVIRDELVKMTKYVDHVNMHDPLRNDHDVHYLYANLPSFDRLEFVLEIYKNVVSLSLLEKVYREGGQYFDSYEENLTNFILDKGQDVDYIYSVLNIKKTDRGGRAFDDGIDNILLRKIYLRAMSEKIRETSVKLEREAFEETVAMLKGAGRYGEKVLRAFVEKLNDRQEIIENKDDPDYNKSLNDILLSAMELVTDEKDLSSSSNRQVYNKVKSFRNEKIAPVIEESKENITPNSVKGKFFEITKKDISAPEMSVIFGDLSQDTLVNKAQHRDAPAPIKDVHVITKDEVVAQVVGDKVSSRWDKGSTTETKVKAVEKAEEPAQQETVEVKHINAEDIEIIKARVKAREKAKDKSAQPETVDKLEEPVPNESKEEQPAPKTQKEQPKATENKTETKAKEPVKKMHSDDPKPVVVEESRADREVTQSVAQVDAATRAQYAESKPDKSAILAKYTSQHREPEPVINDAPVASVEPAQDVVLEQKQERATAPAQPPRTSRTINIDPVPLEQAAQVDKSREEQELATPPVEDMFRETDSSAESSDGLFEDLEFDREGVNQPKIMGNIPAQEVETEQSAGVEQ